MRFEQPPSSLSVILSIFGQERTKVAASFKEKGNNAYKDRRYEHAAKLYSRAIELSVKPEPVFYANRAACASYHTYKRAVFDKVPGYVNMTPPRNDLVVEDCNAALGFDPNYIKALNRRAGALEALERFEESLQG